MPPATSSFSHFLLVTLCLCVSLALCAPKGVLVPLYVDPYTYPSDWSRLKQSAQNYSKLQFIAIINLGDGPGIMLIPPPPQSKQFQEMCLTMCCMFATRLKGPARDSAYVEQLSSGVPSNLRFVGYVHTMATTQYKAFRNISLVKQDVDKWYSWYKSLLTNAKKKKNLAKMQTKLLLCTSLHLTTGTRTTSLVSLLMRFPTDGQNRLWEQEQLRYLEETKWKRMRGIKT